MDDIKMFAENEKELKTLLDAVRIYTQAIGMEFDSEKCAIQIMKSGKRHMMEGLEQPNQEKNRMHGEKKIKKRFRILNADTIKRVEMKERI